SHSIFFFFQAEDGIRDFHVTGVQTCALPISYSPIIASGANACVLHYIANNAQCQDGEVILFDVAAEYANYNSDMSRSIPVSGRFSKRQKAVYQSVRRVMQAAMQMLTPGNSIPEYHREVGKIME